MVNPIRRETAYRLFIMAKIMDWYRRGEGDFTADMMARHCGLKPTHNFYRQLRSFVADGSLELKPGYRRSGIRANVYGVVIDPAMEGK